MSSMSKNEDDVEIDSESLLNDLDRKMSRLKVSYDQYFLGIEKRAPLNQLKDVVRLTRLLEQINFSKTAQKFRFRALLQKFYAYRNFWNRTTREIENGTHKRTLKRDKKRIQRREALRQSQEVLDIEVYDVEVYDIEEIPELDLNSPDVFISSITPQSPEPLRPHSSPALTSPASSSQQDTTFESAEAFLQQLGVPTPKPVPNAVANPSPQVPKGKIPNTIRGAARDDLAKRENRLRTLKRRLGNMGGLQRKPQAEESPPEAPEKPKNRTSAKPKRRLGQSGRLSRKGATTTATKTPAVPKHPSPQRPKPSPSKPIRPPAATGQRRPPLSRQARPISRPSKSQPKPQPGPKPQTPAATNAAKPRKNLTKDRTDLASAGLSENKLKGIYDSLIDAKKRCNESTEKLSYEGVVRSISKQTKAVKKKHSSSNVDFQVVIKNGKAFLKPVPK